MAGLDTTRVAHDDNKLNKRNAEIRKTKCFIAILVWVNITIKTFEKAKRLNNYNNQLKTCE